MGAADMHDMRAIAKSLFRRLMREERGNVLMIVGLSIIPLTFATGMAVDYTQAMRLQTRLNAAADAAALSGVTQTAMTQTNGTACATATKMFIAQSTGLPGLTLNTADPAQLKITLTDASGTYDCASNAAGLSNNVSLRRTMVVTYRGQSANTFAGILRIRTLTVKGSSTAFAQIANIDFYLALDMSQSMLLPATTSGLASMVANTQGQQDGYGNKGCAFACHQTETRPYDSNGNSLATDIMSNPLVTPSSPAPTGNNPDTRPRIDNYAVARNLGLTLRTDLVGNAVSALINDAITTEAANGATYRVGISTFDYQYTQRWPTSGNTSNVANYWVDSNLQNVLNYAQTTGGSNGQGWSSLVTPYCLNNYRVCGTNDNDTDTSLTAAITGALANMPAQGGTGTKTSPLAVLFIITDGMRDESNSGRQLGPLPYSLCQQIAARNIQVAVLETQYLPSSASDNWSITNVRNPFLSPTNKISPALYSCAAGTQISSWPPPGGTNPGVLYYQVTTDGDISAALVSLFNMAVAQARLTG